MKTRLKQQILEKRSLLSKEDIGKKSALIKNSLFNLEQYKNSKAIMFFASIGNEVNTHDMIRQALKNKTVIVPKVFHHGIEPSVIISFDNLIAAGKFKIPEPIEAMKIAYKNIEMVLVPGIAFDKEGHRVGYGFGYYDRFLHHVPRAVKVGLAFDFQIVDKVPKEPHDLPVEIIVTEDRVIDCKKSRIEV